MAFLYVSDSTDKTLHEVGLDGSNPTLLFTAIKDPKQINWIHSIKKFVYTRTDMYQLNYDGSGETKIVDETSSLLFGTAIDAAAEKLYYSIKSAGEIKRCDYDGSNPTLQWTSSAPESMALDPRFDKLYWGNDTSLFRADTPDGDNEQTLVTGISNLEHLTLDLVNNKIYWADSGAKLIKRADLDGSNVETVITATPFVWGVAVDGANGKVYWTETNPKNVKRADLNGDNQEVIWSGVTSPYSLLIATASLGATTGRKTFWGPWHWLGGPGKAFGQSIPK